MAKGKGNPCNRWQGQTIRLIPRPRVVRPVNLPSPDCWLKDPGSAIRILPSLVRNTDCRSTSKLSPAVRAGTRRERYRRWVVLIRTESEIDTPFLSQPRRQQLSAERFKLELMNTQDSDDIAMYEWNGTILGPPHSAYENRIFSLSIFCGDRYPGESVRYR
jgi:hypothetical protein